MGSIYPSVYQVTAPGYTFGPSNSFCTTFWLKFSRKNLVYRKFILKIKIFKNSSKFKNFGSEQYEWTLGPFAYYYPTSIPIINRNLKDRVGVGLGLSVHQETLPSFNRHLQTPSILFN